MNLLKPTDAAKLLGVSVDTLNNYARKGIVRFGRRVFLRRCDLNKRVMRYRVKDIELFIGGRYA